MSEHVLVIYPHPDDEAFSCSGTLMGYIEKGVPVTYICLTLGEMGRNMGKTIFANRETLPVIREKELKAACQVIGIEDLRMWGLRDKTIEFEPVEELAARFVGAINEIRPSLIITFYPGFSVHPDHDSCGHAVIEAVKMLPERERPEVHCVAFSKDCFDVLGQPDVINYVGDRLEKKIATLKSHDSQFGGMMANMEPLIKAGDSAVMERLTKERFWIYKF